MKLSCTHQKTITLLKPRFFAMDELVFDPSFRQVHTTISKVFNEHMEREIQHIRVLDNLLHHVQDAYSQSNAVVEQLQDELSLEERKILTA